MDKYSKYGTIYTAVDDLPDENPCKRMTGRCALRGRCFLAGHADVPPCRKTDRPDGRSIHWEVIDV